MLRHAAFVALALVLGSPALADDGHKTLKPVVMWTGVDSKQAKMSFARSRTQAEWQVVWHRHHGRDKDLDDRTCPEIDFDSHMVIAIFQGESFQDTGLGIVEMREEKECLRIRYKPKTYSIGYVTPLRGTVEFASQKFKLDTQSYAFLVLPRTGKEVIVEEDVRMLKHAPPVWKERAKLPAAEKR